MTVRSWRSATLGLAVLLVFGAARVRAEPESEPEIKLVVAIVVDQLRYDYLYRFRDDLSGGMARLLEGGAVFSDAHLGHYPSVTAVGHAALMSGAPPALSGIMGNDWYDRKLGKNVACVEDESVSPVGDEAVPPAGDESVSPAVEQSVGSSSPHRLLVSTVGDELKMAGRGRSKVIGMSLKERGAILPAGRMADAAYWFDAKTGHFVSSTYYLDELPVWVKEHNARGLPESYAGVEWRPVSGEAVSWGTMPTEPPAIFAAVRGTPFGNEVLEELVEAGLIAEQLGQRGVPDLLTVSFSSTDYVGHGHGPDSPRLRDAILRVDLTIGKLLDALDEAVGLADTLVVFTSDHGVAPVPEDLAKWKMPGGRMGSADLFGPIEAALDAELGEGDWIVGTAGSSAYLNHALIGEKGLDAARVRRVAAEAAMAVPHVARVYTRDQLLLGQVPPDLPSRWVLRSYNQARSGDLEILLEPFWMRLSRGTTHGSAYSYDTHIPLVFMGPGITPGRYHGSVVLQDVAPTVAELLKINPPSGSVGRILGEMLAAAIVD